MAERSAVAPTPRGRTLAPVAFVVHGRRRNLLALAAASYLSGVIEALFLVTITRVALAISDDGADVELFGVGRRSIGEMLLVGVVLLALRSLLTILASRQAAQLTAGVVADVRRTLTRAFVAASWDTQQRERMGSLQELMSTFSNQTSAMISGLGQMVITTANLVALVGLALIVDPVGAVVLVVAVGVLAMLLRPLRSLLARRSKQSADAGMEFAASLAQVSTLGMELHVFNVNDEAADRVEATIDEVERRARSVHFVTGLVNPLYSGVAFLAVVGALAVVSTSDSADFESLGTVMLLMLRSFSYGQAMQRAYAAVTSAAPFVAELQDRLAHYERGRAHHGGEPVGRVGRLEAVDVSFEYDPGPPVLRGVSFTLEPREIVGIIGPSGGGKSTLVQLLLGLRDPTAGQVRADGRNIEQLAKSEWARKVTFVPQDPRLISGTVADNIRFFRTGVSDEEVRRAARLAHIHEDIVEFPDGYERDLGGQGGQLSGGQRQRVCIARALVERPEVLILDEPTSALDVRSEHLIRETLLGLTDSMTVVIIAHRLSTLEMCSRIMVIQDGELKAFDAPDRLEQSSPFYREALALSGLR